MADNLDTQSAAPATPPANTKFASRAVTYSGDAAAHLAPVGIVLLSGSDDAKTATDVGPTAALPIKQVGATSVLANVGGSASSVTVLASNANRLRAFLYNDSTSDVYVKLGATASVTSFTKRLLPNDFWEVPIYTGIIDAIWTSAVGAMRVTELTA